MSNPALSLNIPETGRPRVVIIGGGFGGINVAQNLPRKEFQVVMFDKHNYHTFQPLLYQVATAGLLPDSIASPLRSSLNRLEDFHFRLFKIEAINTEKKTVLTPAGELTYDYLVIAAGSVSNYFGNDTLAQHVLPLKSIPNALNFRSQLMQLFETAEMTVDPKIRIRLLNFVIVGAGPTGVEMAGALAELRKRVLPKDYPALDFSQMKIHIVEGMDRLLPPMSQKASQRAYRELKKMGIEIHLNTMVDSYDGVTLSFKNASPIQTSTVVWSAGVTGVQIGGLREEWKEKGRLKVNQFCQVDHKASLFAIGDIALMKTREYPKGYPGVAQTAIQMGMYVGQNLVRLQRSEKLFPFKYKDKGTLATIGRGKALLDLPGGKFIGGRLAWWIWLFVHINYLISFRNKLVVFSSWIWNYFTFDKGNRLIIRPYIKKNKQQEFMISTVE